MSVSDKKSTAVAEVEEIVRDDDSQMTYQAIAQDQWRGAIVEDGWHYCIVTEHPASMPLPSNRLKYLQMGYTVAPAPKSIRDRWDEAKSWTMRIPQDIWEKRQKEAQDKAAENRNMGSTPQSPDMVRVGDSERGKKSLAELANG